MEDEQILDPHYGAILEGLNRRLDPELFEVCANDLLNRDWPGLVPIRGGQDDGFDGAIADTEGSDPFPLITTTSKELLRNIKSNLQQALRKRWKIKRAIFATSRRITPSMRKKLHKAASELGVHLVQTYDRYWFAARLYREPSWCKRLLGVTGRPSALSVFPVTSRPLIGDKVYGRDEEFRWLLESNTDCLLVGGPASGKTFLLRALVLKGFALFLVDTDSENIANAIHKQKPSAIIIDDAHVDPDIILN